MSKIQMQTVRRSLPLLKPFYPACMDLFFPYAPCLPSTPVLLQNGRWNFLSLNIIRGKGSRSLLLASIGLLGEGVAVVSF